MSGHTPGPWIAERNRLDGHEWYVKSKQLEPGLFSWCPRLRVGIRPLAGRGLRGEVDSRSGTGSTDVGRCPEAIAENAANARLIAAAPDMLAALERIASETAATWVSDVAKAAIAKATQT